MRLERLLYLAIPLILVVQNVAWQYDDDVQERGLDRKSKKQSYRRFVKRGRGLVEHGKVKESEFPMDSSVDVAAGRDGERMPEHLRESPALLLRGEKGKARFQTGSVADAETAAAGAGAPDGDEAAKAAVWSQGRTLNSKPYEGLNAEIADAAEAVPSFATNVEPEARKQIGASAYAAGRDEEGEPAHLSRNHALNWLPFNELERKKTNAPLHMENLYPEAQVQTDSSAGAISAGAAQPAYVTHGRELELERYAVPQMNHRMTADGCGSMRSNVQMDMSRDTSQLISDAARTKAASRSFDTASGKKLEALQPKLRSDASICPGEIRPAPTYGSSISSGMICENEGLAECIGSIFQWMHGQYIDMDDSLHKMQVQLLSYNYGSPSSHNRICGNSDDVCGNGATNFPGHFGGSASATSLTKSAPEANGRSIEQNKLHKFREQVDTCKDILEMAYQQNGTHISENRTAGFKAPTVSAGKAPVYGPTSHYIQSQLTAFMDVYQQKHARKRHSTLPRSPKNVYSPRMARNERDNSFHYVYGGGDEMNTKAADLHQSINKKNRNEPYSAQFGGSRHLSKLKNKPYFDSKWQAVYDDTS